MTHHPQSIIIGVASRAFTSRRGSTVYIQAAFDRSLNTNESYSRAKQMLHPSGPAIPEATGAQAVLEHDIWSLLRSDIATLRAIRFVSPDDKAIRLIVEPDHAERLLRLLLPRRLNKTLYGIPGLRARCSSKQDIDLVCGQARVTIRTGQWAQQLLDRLPRGTRWRPQTAVTADEQAAAEVPFADYEAVRASEVLRHLHRYQHGAGNIRAHEAGRYCSELAWHCTLAVPAISTYVGMPLLPASDQAAVWPLDPDNRTGTVVYLQSGQRHGQHGEPIRYWLPWGNTGRLMLAWLGGQALIDGDRQLHTRELYAFLSGNGIKVDKRPKQIREQLFALLGMTICMDRPPSAVDPYDVGHRMQIGSQWATHGDHHAAFILSPSFIDEAIRETVYLDPLIVHHLAGDARLLELYQWLARQARTFLEPVTYTWDQVWQRFGERNEEGKLRAPSATGRARRSRRQMSPPFEYAARFQFAIGYQIEKVLGCMPGCRVTVDKNGVRIDQLR
jgi:hypothetical protein